MWAVVFDMKNLKHVEAQIVKSHERGESCLVQKQLESVNDGQDYFRGDTKRLPRLFAESQLDKNQLDLQHFCPPASDRDDEYHIIKFYSFSTAIVFSMLQMDQSRNVDFPFQVTELEYRIINLSSKAPIILLGRSGTGKTTCCLYRLWMNFVNYWSKVKLTEDPIYPNNFVEMRQPEDCEQHERDEDEKKAEHQATGCDYFLIYFYAYLYILLFLLTEESAMLSVLTCHLGFSQFPIVVTYLLCTFSINSSGFVQVLKTLKSPGIL